MFQRFMDSRAVSWAGLALLGAVGAIGVCCSSGPTYRQYAAHARHPLVPVVMAGKVDLAHTDAGQSRILLDAAGKARLRASVERNTPAYRNTLERCEAYLGKAVPAGYEAFNWANALASLALCWHATSDPRFARGAAGYLQALLDDRAVVGDGKGGDEVVHHDHGYGIRTFGAYSALGYDWLRNSPAITPELEHRVQHRLDAWLSWYAQEGYLRDNPVSNYFWGYMTTLTFAGLALHGETSQADQWLERARGLFAKQIVPVFRTKLRGGNWPEGWQYGEYTTTEIALVALALKSATGMDAPRELPWLEETVTYHVHALAPDKRSVYDGGTWSKHPAKPSALGLQAVALALDDQNPERASEARWLMRRVLPPLDESQAWIGLLTDSTGKPDKDPHHANQTSLLVPGSGLTFMRSDWSPAATWVTFQAGTRLAQDHQHEDQGHFEFWRGSDALLVDGGGSEGDATINHNTMLVDDKSRCMTYTPNQGVFGHDMRTTAFADEGGIAVVSGDIAEAYAPACAREGCSQRAVSKFLRTLVYVKPSVLVLHDDIAVTKESDGTTWAAHLTVNPSVSGSRISATVGDSRVDIQSLLPDRARIDIRKEPTESGENIHRKNQPWGPMWRVEIDAPRETAQRTFLQYIVASSANAKPAGAERLSGKGLIGARGTLRDGSFAVLFADSDKGGEVTLSNGVKWAAIAGLTPGKRYRARVVAERNCTLDLRSDEQGNATANSGGLLRLETSECATSRR